MCVCERERERGKENECVRDRGKVYRERKREKTRENERESK